MKAALILTILCLLFAGCRAPAPADHTLTISAAASLKDAFQEIAAIYKAQTKGEVTFNFGASGTLEKQIENGAAVDVFASAGGQQMDELAMKGLIDAASRKDFAGNDLVLIVPKSSKLKLRPSPTPKKADDDDDDDDEKPPPDPFVDALSAGDIQRIAVGNPKTVPAGIYAEEVFTYMQVDAAFRQRLVLAEDVRQVLDYVVRGEVDAGIVYRTDALAAGDRVRMIAAAPAASHAPIAYPVAVIKDSPQKDAAAKFVEILTGPVGQAVLKKYGFLPLTGAQ